MADTDAPLVGFDKDNNFVFRTGRLVNWFRQSVQPALNRRLGQAKKQFNEFAQSVKKNTPSWASHPQEIVDSSLRHLKKAYSQVLDAATGVPLDQKYIRVAMPGDPAIKVQRFGKDAIRPEHSSTVYFIPRELGEKKAKQLAGIMHGGSQAYYDGLIKGAKITGLSTGDDAGKIVTKSSGLFSSFSSIWGGSPYKDTSWTPEKLNAYIKEHGSLKVSGLVYEHQGTDIKERNSGISYLEYRSTRLEGKKPVGVRFEVDGQEVTYLFGKNGAHDLKGLPPLPDFTESIQHWHDPQVRDSVLMRSWEQERLQREAMGGPVIVLGAAAGKLIGHEGAGRFAPAMPLAAPQTRRVSAFAAPAMRPAAL